MSYSGCPFEEATPLGNLAGGAAPPPVVGWRLITRTSLVRTSTPPPTTSADAPISCTTILTKDFWKQTGFWSLTQFYSVDFSQSKIGVKRAFSTNTQSRFASVVFGRSLGPLPLVQHPMNMICIYVVPEAMHEATLRALEKDTV